MYKQRSFKEAGATGTLYLVPTPIGNLEDMTFRGVKTLQGVDLIASEDTRNTQKLLNHFEVTTPQKSLHEHNYKERIPFFLEFLAGGQSVAQVSDAGMPSISDPGHELVVACIEREIPVVSLPGPTAGLTALIASGLSPQPNLFVGFLPRKKNEQLSFLAPYQAQAATMMFYESPYRIAATIGVMGEVFGQERPAVICRELTKLHEEYLRGSLGELAAYLSENTIKGECCILVAGFDGEVQEEVSQLSIKEQVEALIAEGMKPNAAIKTVAQKNSRKKQEIYQEYHGLS